MLHVEERGKGDAVVLLHGAPMSPAHLLPLAERLAQSRRVLVVHLPGYGRSRPLEPYSMEASHAVVEEALQARGCSRCHIIGFEGGAYRAIALAVRGAIRARSVAALAGGADLSAEDVRRITHYVRMLRSETGPATLLEELVLSPRGRENGAWVGDVRGWRRSIDTDNLARELEAFASAPDLRGPLGQLDIPLLARVGSIDLVCPPERCRRLLDVARNVVFEEVPGVGHALLCEDFPATLASIERHLARAS